MPTVTIDESTFYYVEKGNGKIPVLFVHGLLLSSNMWLDFYLPSFPDKFHTYALDMRGHGKSNDLNGCTIQNMAEDVFRFAKQLAIEKFIFIGVSMGGGVGIQLALHHPDILIAQILISPVTGFGKSGVFLFRLLGYFIAQKRWLMRIIIKNLLLQPPLKSELESALDDAMLVRASVMKEFIGDKEPIKDLKLLKTLKIPTCIIFGDKDTAVPAVQQNRLAESIPYAQKIVYPGEGHMVVRERQENVLRDILKFLEEIDSMSPEIHGWFASGAGIA